MSIAEATRLPAKLKYASSDASLFKSAGRKNMVLVLLLIALTLFVYQPVKDFDFVDYDDPFYVTSNIPVQNGLSWKNLAWAFTSVEVANWHPLTWLSHMADVQMFGLNPAGHHFTSVLWHALNVVLLFLLLRRATGSLWGSAFVAAVFAVHPLNIQSVAWVSERKNVLSTFLWFAALYSYGWYALKPNWKRYLLTLVLLAAGLVSKPMLVTFPFGLLLLDYWPLRRMKLEQDPTISVVAGQYRVAQYSLRWLVIEKLPFLLLALLSVFVTYRAQQMFGAMGAHDDFPLRFRIENALVSYATYLYQAVWPTRLSAFYPLSVFNLWQPILCFLLLASVTASVLWFRSKRYLAAGWFWYLGTLVPVIGLLQLGVQARADRYTYVPLIGVFLMLTWTLAEVARRAPRLRPAMAVVALLAIALLSWDARIQLSYWRDSIALFSRSLEITPQNNYIAHANLGKALSDAGRLHEAFPHLYFVVRQFPRDAWARNDFATVLLRAGKLKEAIAEYETALKTSVDSRLAAYMHTSLGVAYAGLGEVDRAESHYREAVTLNAWSVDTENNWGELLYKNGKLNEAVVHLQRSLSVLPTSRAWLLLAAIYSHQNRNIEALEAYREALRLEPDNAEAAKNIPLLEQRIEKAGS